MNQIGNKIKNEIENLTDSDEFRLTCLNFEYFEIWILYNIWQTLSCQTNFAQDNCWNNNDTLVNLWFEWQVQIALKWYYFKFETDV